MELTALVILPNRMQSQSLLCLGSSGRTLSDFPALPDRVGMSAWDSGSPPPSQPEALVQSVSALNWPTHKVEARAGRVAGELAQLGWRCLSKSRTSVRTWLPMIGVGLPNFRVQ